MTKTRIDNILNVNIAQAVAQGGQLRQLILADVKEDKRLRLQVRSIGPQQNPHRRAKLIDCPLISC